MEHTAQVSSDGMSKSAESSKNLFLELAARGIGPAEYAQIKQIVEFGLPQAQMLFYRRFGRRTIASVLEQIERWRHFLKKQSLITGEERDRLAKLIASDEYLAWSSLLAVNLPNIGPWSVRCSFRPSRVNSSDDFRYAPASLEVKAVHRDNREERRTVIPGNQYSDPTSFGMSWKKAFDELDLSRLLRRGYVHKCTISRRREQAWPAFTQHVIPAVYEYLHPFYKRPGHYFTTRDGMTGRAAWFPQELLEHMLAILRLEHPDTFARATTGHLKAAIQRHLDRKTQSTNSSK